MDETDSDIIIPLVTKSNQTNIFYYDSVDYNSKLINLVRMFGRKKMEEYIFHGKVCFVAINSKG